MEFSELVWELETAVMLCLRQGKHTSQETCHGWFYVGAVGPSTVAQRVKNPPEMQETW